MNACQAVRELLAAHALGALEASEGALVRDHLAACAGCRAAEAEATACLELVAAPAVAAPKAVWGRLQERIRHERSGDGPVRNLEPGAVIALSCSFCRDGLVRAQAVYCASCLAPHHPDCWDEYGRCSVMGCGETRIVRPADLPALEPGRRRRRRRRSRRVLPWLVVGVASAGAGAAAFTSAARPTAVSTGGAPAGPSPSRSLAAATQQRLDVVVEEARLDAVCRRLEAETGVSVHASSVIEDALVRDARWEGATLAEVVAGLRDRLGVEVRSDWDRGWVLLLPGGPAPLEPAGEQVAVDASRLHPAGGGEPVGLFAGGRHRLVPGGRRLAVVAGGEIRVLRGTQPEGQVSLPAPPTGLAWSPGGTRLAHLGSDGGELVLGVMDLAPELGQAHWTAPLPPALDHGAELAWLADDALVVYDRDRVVHVAAPAGGRLRPSLAREARAAADRLEALTPLPGAPGAALALLPGRVERWQVGAGGVRSGFQVACAADAPVQVAGDGALALLVGADAAVPFSLADVAQAGAPIERRGEAAWEVALAPDGRRVAWLDGGALSLRRLGPAARVPDEDGLQVTFDQRVEVGGGAPLRGLAWDAAGARLAFWSARAVYVLGAEALADGRATVDLDAPLATLADGAVAQVAWAGDDLVVRERRLRARRPVVRVERVAGPAPAPSEADPVARWFEEPPEEAPAAEGPAVVADADAEPGAGAAPTADPAGLHEPPAPIPSPSPAATPAPADAGADPEAAAPEPTVDLGHVRIGQRWVYAFDEHTREVWTVESVGVDEVVYSVQVFFDAKPLSEPSRQVWTPEREVVARVLGRPNVVERKRVRISGLTLPVVVATVGDTVTWRVEVGGRVTFPGAVRYLRGGDVVRQLVAVE